MCTSVDLARRAAPAASVKHVSFHLARPMLATLMLQRGVVG
jgi:hypothetical protein